jgi:hypothetical protein
MGDVENADQAFARRRGGGCWREAFGWVCHLVECNQMGLCRKGGFTSRQWSD